MNSPEVLNVIIVTKEVDTVVRLFYISGLALALIFICTKLKEYVRGFK